MAISSSTCLLLPSSETRRTDGCCAITAEAHNKSAMIEVDVNSPCKSNSSSVFSPGTHTLGRIGGITADQCASPMFALRTALSKFIGPVYTARLSFHFAKPDENTEDRQGHAVLAGFLGWTLDAFDYFVVIFMFDTLAAHFHVSKAEVVRTTVYTLALRPVGALIFGLLADRY